MISCTLLPILTFLNTEASGCTHFTDVLSRHFFVATWHEPPEIFAVLAVEILLIKLMSRVGLQHSSAYALCHYCTLDIEADTKRWTKLYCRHMLCFMNVKVAVKIKWTKI